MENVDKIRDTETKTDQKYPGGKVVPATPVVIESVTLKGEYSMAALEAAVEEAKKQEAFARIR